MLNARLVPTYSGASSGAPLQSLPHPAGEMPIRHCVPARAPPARSDVCFTAALPNDMSFANPKKG
jgi:hypothetical protein